MSKEPAKNATFPKPALRARHNQERNCCGNAAVTWVVLALSLVTFLAGRKIPTYIKIRSLLPLVDKMQRLFYHFAGLVELLQESLVTAHQSYLVTEF